MPALPRERYITILDAANDAIEVVKDIHRSVVYARDHSPELEQARELISTDPDKAAEVLYSAYNGLIDLILGKQLSIERQLQLAREVEHFSRTSRRTLESRKRMRILRETRATKFHEGDYTYTAEDFERESGEGKP